MSEQREQDDLKVTGITNGHTHTWRKGATRTGISAGHSHPIAEGASRTGPGGGDRHTHSL